MISIFSLVAELKSVESFARRHNPHDCHRTTPCSLISDEFNASLGLHSPGEKQLAEFLAAVDGLKISNLSYHVFNNVITPGQAGGGELSGIVYTRNVVFTIRRPQPGENSSELDRMIAQLEDLGARYNSHCVTCVGSG